MGIITWVIIGLIVGFLASSIAKRTGVRKMSILAASLVGALIGGLNAAYLYQVPGAIDGVNWIGMLAAFAGAFVGAALLNLLDRQKSPVV